MKAESTSSEFNSISLSIEELIKIRVALFDVNLTLRRLSKVEGAFKERYIEQLNQIKESEAILSAATKREFV